MYYIDIYIDNSYVKLKNESRGEGMNGKLKEKIQESFTSILPISAIVLLLGVIFVDMSIETFTMFLFGALLLMVGIAFFSLGTEVSMTPMGEDVGTELTKSNKVWFIGGICFILGFIITIAEPDLKVVANQVASIPNTIFILTVAIGVGIFLVISMLRIVFRIDLGKLLIVLYLSMFILSIFVPKSFLSVAFDSGGVTTGPITVPFILAVGVGLSSIRKGRESQDDSFGLVALSCVGPVLAVMILGILYNPQDTVYDKIEMPKVETMNDVWHQFATELPIYIKEILLALVPIVVFFILFQLVTRKYRKRQLLRMGVGIIYTIIGLILFLTGANVGFSPVGNLMGSEVASSAYKWLLIPLGMVIGYFIVAAEPAVPILNKQVEDITDGSIPASAMNLGLSIGVAASVALGMIRVLTGISISWFIIPGYIISLVLSFFVPKIFTGIAFDSGAVVSGPMSATFLLPFAIGASEALNGNVLTDAFGIVALIAMTPVIAIQIMGLVYKLKMDKKVSVEKRDTVTEVFEDYVESKEAKK